jgi:hypothetical protein
LAAKAFCSSGDAEGEKGLSPLLWVPPRGLRKGDSAAPGLKVLDEPERGDEEK